MASKEEDEEVNNAKNEIEDGSNAKEEEDNDGGSNPQQQQQEREEEDETKGDDDNDEDDENDEGSDSDDDSGSSSGADDDSDNDDDDDDDDGGEGKGGDGNGNDNDDEHGGLSEYERLRLERIKRNKERLIQLGLESRDGEGGMLGKKRKRPQVQRRKSNEKYASQPTRKSSRSQSLEPKNYVEPSLRGLLQTIKNETGGNDDAAAETQKNKPKTAAATATPSKPRSTEMPRKPSRVDLRPTREIYDEFQAIRRDKKQTLKEAQKHVRNAEKEVKYWHKKVTVTEKKKKTKSSQKQCEAQRSEQMLAKEKEAFGGLSAQDFLAEIEQRKEEIETKIAEYDLHTMTPEQKMELEAKRIEHQNKLKLLEAKEVVTKTLKTMAKTLSSCLLERTPKDRPPPRRNRRRGEGDSPHGGREADHDKSNSTTNKKRGRKKSQGPSQQPSSEKSKMSRAAAQASLSQLEMLLESSAEVNDANDNQSSTTKDSSDENKSKKKLEKREKREINVGGWVSGTFASRIDRSWLEQDVPQSQLRSIKTYVPQPGDTLLYYPAGHFEFLNKYPDHLCNGRLDRIPLWERATKERANAIKGQEQCKEEKDSAENTAASNNWWTDDWIDIAGSGEYFLPILCRVVKTKAEFPPDSTQWSTDNNNNNQATTAAPGTASQSKSKTWPVLRLAVTLRPLTPVTPPTWTDAGPDDTASVQVPPVFTCVTFPSPLEAFLVPFAWSYIRNQSLVVGGEVLHSPAKASVTGKPLHQKGKLLSLTTQDGDYGSYRLDDKLDYVALVLSGLKKTNENAIKLADSTKGKGESSIEISPQDAFVIGDFLEGVLRKHGAPTSADDNGASARAGDLMTLVRATFPAWMGASVQRGLEDRTRLELQPWDLKTKHGPVGGDAAAILNDFMDFGLHNTLDNMLRLKIECSIEGYIQATPTTTPFQEQITEAVAPNYSAVVPITMSFRRILTRLKQKGKRPNPDSPCYYRSIDAILADIQAIEDNCRLYNAPDSLVTKSAIEVVANAKKYVSGIVTSHVRELKDRLKEEDAKKHLLAALVGENDESLENTGYPQNIKSVDPFREPWKGPLFRDWIQLTGEKHRRSKFTQWVPQAGDTVLYSRDMHAKFLEGHLDSLSANQCFAFDDSTWNVQETAVSEDAEAGSSSGESKWIAATIVSVRAEFPRVRKASEQGTFVTEAPLLALRLQLSGVNYGKEENTSVIYWRPCMFPDDISDVMEPETVCCQACGLRNSSSFLRPSWGIHVGNECQLPGGESCVPEGIARTELHQIEQNVNFLKRRCLLHVVPDKLDANLSTDQVKNGYFPTPVKVGQNSLPQFDRLLTAAEAEAEVPSRLAKKKKVGASEIDNSALNNLAAVGFLPPWLPQANEVTKSKKQVSGTPLHDSVSPWPNLCLELVLQRIRNGYYRHLTAVHNDLVEAFLNTQLLSWAPAAKRKLDPIAMEKLSKALWCTKYAVTTDDRPFTSITQAVVAKQKTTESDTRTSIKVRIILEDPKENQEIPAKSRKKTAKPPKKQGKSLVPAQASGTKRKASSSSIEENKMLLTAEVPIWSLRSLGRQEALWVQCDKCKKWRRLRGLVGNQKLPSRWYCSMNSSDPTRALCSAPEEEYDPVAHEISTDADDPKDALSEEDSSFVAHAELLRRLYTAALVGISEPTHFSVVFGLTQLHVNRQLLSTIVPKTYTQADHQAAYARNQLATLLKAIARDPCKSNLPKEITLRMFVDGDLVKGEKLTMPASTADVPAAVETPVSIDGLKFGKRNLRSNNKLTRVLFKPIGNRPCVRCQAARKGLFTCRVLKSHSNVDFDLYQNFKGGGGLDGLLCTMLKLEPVAPKVHDDPDNALSSGETEGVLQSQIVTSAVAGEEQAKPPDDDVEKGSSDKGMPANEADGVRSSSAANGVSGDGKETALGESSGNGKDEFEPAEMYRRARAALELAKELRAMAEAYSEAPDRLSNEFIATTFPFDSRDNSYAFCIICGLPGDLLLCDNKNGCPNVMHRHCGGLSEVPEADWFCGQCVPIPLTGDDMKEDTTTPKVSIVTKSSTPTTPEPKDDPEADRVDTKEEDAQIETEANEKKPAVVTSCLPPIVTFDDKKALYLSSELDDLYFFRTGRRREAKTNNEGRQSKPRER